CAQLRDNRRTHCASLDSPEVVSMSHSPAPVDPPLPLFFVLPRDVSFAGVTLRCRFRFGDFLGWLITDPIGVENSRLVDALIGMRAEEVALRLQQIRRQTRGTIAVEVGQGSAEGRRGHAVINGG